MRQLAGCVALQAPAKVSHQNAQQQVAKAGISICITKLKLYQFPERRSQIVGGHVLPSFGLGRQVCHAVHHHGTVKALQYGEQLGLVGTRQHRQHLAIQVLCVVARQHQALEAVHTVLGA